MDRLFAGPILQNNVRADHVEERVATALERIWRHAARDWTAWDFQQADGPLKIPAGAVDYSDLAGRVETVAATL